MIPVKCPICNHNLGSITSRLSDFERTVSDVLQGVTVESLVKHDKDLCSKMILEFALHFMKVKQEFMDKEFGDESHTNES